MCVKEHLHHAGLGHRPDHHVGYDRAGREARILFERC